MVAGTVGGGGRVEFTVIGDAVNTASRVEAATRETGDDILITDATRELLPDGRFELAAALIGPDEGQAGGGAGCGLRQRGTGATERRAAGVARGRAGAGLGGRD